MDIPYLSIYVATYNHEAYIVRALESIRMQKTQYTYEVLVGEDCSTDNTRVILQNYEQQNPGIFTIFYRDHNMHKEKLSNAGDLKRRCRGKYIIALEGDDYWTDPYKIEKQITFLENNPEYIAVSHNCMVVDHNSEPKNETYPECHSEEYTFQHLLNNILPGQLTTVMYRNVWKGASLLEKRITPGDRPLYFWMLCNGKVRCIQDKMSAYRHVVDQGSSHSATYKYNFWDDDYHYRCLMEYAEEINNKQALSCAEDLYFRHIVRALRHRRCTVTEFLTGFSCIAHKTLATVRYITYKINKHVFHIGIFES